MYDEHDSMKIWISYKHSIFFLTMDDDHWPDHLLLLDQFCRSSLEPEKRFESWTAIPLATGCTNKIIFFFKSIPLLQFLSESKILKFHFSNPRLISPPWVSAWRERWGCCVARVEPWQDFRSKYSQRDFHHNQPSPSTSPSPSPVS